MLKIIFLYVPEHEKFVLYLRHQLQEMLLSKTF